MTWLKKNSLNDTLVNLIIFISYIVVIGAIITFVISWQKTNDLWFLLPGVLISIGTILNIYRYKKLKSNKNEV